MNFEDLNNLKLESRYLTPEEVNSAGVSYLSRRIHSILMNARKKVIDQSLTYNVRGILLSIMSSGVAVLKNGSELAIKNYYLNTYGDLIKKPTMTDWQLVEGDFDLKVDSLDMQELALAVKNFDTDMTEMHLKGQSVLLPSGTMSGMWGNDGAETTTTKRIIQYAILGGLLYGVWYYTLKQDSKLISKRL
jgi:hypothetical protein